MIRFFSARNESRLTKTGDPALGNDFSPVSFVYTGKHGDTLDFTVAKYSSYPLPGSVAPVRGDPFFKANTWTFKDGTVVTFAYVLQRLAEAFADQVPFGCTESQCNNPPMQNSLPFGYVLQSVSNNYGRSLTFTTASDSVPVVVSQGGFPAYQLFPMPARITRVTDENNRYVEYLPTGCPANYGYSAWNGSQNVFHAFTNGLFACTTSPLVRMTALRRSTLTCLRAILSRIAATTGCENGSRRGSEQRVPHVHVRRSVPYQVGHRQPQ